MIVVILLLLCNEMFAVQKNAKISISNIQKTLEKSFGDHVSQLLYPNTTLYNEYDMILNPLREKISRINLILKRNNYCDDYYVYEIRNEFKKHNMKVENFIKKNNIKKKLQELEELIVAQDHKKIAIKKKELTKIIQELQNIRKRFEYDIMMLILEIELAINFIDALNTLYYDFLEKSKLKKTSMTFSDFLMKNYYNNNETMCMLLNHTLRGDKVLYIYSQAKKKYECFMKTAEENVNQDISNVYHVLKQERERDEYHADIQYIKDKEQELLC